MRSTQSIVFIIFPGFPRKPYEKSIKSGSNASKNLFPEENTRTIFKISHKGVSTIHKKELIIENNREFIHHL